VPGTSRYGRVEVRAWDGMHQKVPAVTNKLGQPLDVEVPGDPSPAPAALVRCRTCAALTEIEWLGSVAVGLVEPDVADRGDIPAQRGSQRTVGGWGDRQAC
jgi:hypothetical protein